MRLDKFLCACRAGSRTEVKKYIKKGLVTVNGKTAARPEDKVDEKSDIVCVNGRTLSYEEFSYYLLYKEAGYVTAVTDRLHQTVMDELPGELSHLTPIGRLDVDTEGLLFLTNDGAFAHHVLSPAHHVKKTYEATLDKPVPQSAVEAFGTGIDIGDEKPALPAELVILPEQRDADGAAVYTARLTISEGRYHQVKRMFAAVGCTVIGLRRTQIGDITLEGLLPGQYRKLSAKEVKGLYQ